MYHKDPNGWPFLLCIIIQKNTPYGAAVLDNFSYMDHARVMGDDPQVNHRHGATVPNGTDYHRRGHLTSWEGCPTS